MQRTDVTTLKVKLVPLEDLPTTTTSPSEWAFAEDTFQQDIEDLQTNVGDLDNLTTTEKSNLVGAINEIDSNKISKNNAITGATKCKITYDSKGLVTAGADLSASDIPSLTLSKISDVTADASELNILDGATLTTTELNYVDGVTSSIQTQLDDKVAKNNAITGATKTKITYDSKGLVTAGADLTASDIPSLTLSKISDVTATAEELNILDGATLTTTELNYLDGVTSDIQTLLNSKQPMINDLTDIRSGAEAGATALQPNAAITGATKCKITYDSNGLVTAGADLAASDIPDISATYQTKITSSNKISADLISDGETNKTVTATEKSTWSGKQDALVSGTNIKTINNESVLGSGNITIDSLPAQSGQSGKFLTTDGTDASWATVDALPSQSGQSGKFLGTDGSTASWQSVPSNLPAQSGQSGKILSTDGTDASWIDIPVSDVTIDSTSIVTNGVAAIPIAQASGDYGLVKLSSDSAGIMLSNSGTLQTRRATDSDIIAKTQINRPIVPANLDIAIREGLGNNLLTWSDAYKTSARNTIGATQVVIREWD